MKILRLIQFLTNVVSLMSSAVNDTNENILHDLHLEENETNEKSLMVVGDTHHIRRRLKYAAKRNEVKKFTPNMRIESQKERTRYDHSFDITEEDVIFFQSDQMSGNYLKAPMDLSPSLSPNAESYYTTPPINTVKSLYPTDQQSPKTNKPSAAPEDSEGTNVAPSVSTKNSGLDSDLRPCTLPSNQPNFKPSLVPTSFPSCQYPTTLSFQHSSELPKHGFGQRSQAPSLSPDSQPTLLPSRNPSESPKFPDSNPTFIPFLNPTESPTIDSVQNALIQNKCGMSPSERSRSIDFIISAAITTPKGISQSKALAWLIDVDDALLCPPISEVMQEIDNIESSNIIQRYVVSLLYFALDGKNWSVAAPKFKTGDKFNQADNLIVNNTTSSDNGFLRQRYISPFLDMSHECDWFGIQCDQNMKVTSIRLNDNALKGPLIQEISELLYLKELTLDGNKQITGSIPASFGRLSYLEVIDLDHNQMSSTIPESLFGLTNLIALDLNNNHLEGSISSYIGNLSKLVFIQLDNNIFTGTIPSEIGRLYSLNVLTIYKNQLSGEVPSEICDLRYNYLNDFWMDCMTHEDQSTGTCKCCTKCL